MKSIIIIFFLFSFSVTYAQVKVPKTKPSETVQKIQVVEASCGQCNFAMKEKGCTLAVRIDGKSYFVDGTDIDSHGDAHDDDGFCNAIKKAEVRGEIINNRFKASHFKIVPPVSKKD